MLRCSRFAVRNAGVMSISRVAHIRATATGARNRIHQAEALCSQTRLIPIPIFDPAISFATPGKLSGRNGKRSACLDYQERRPRTQNKKENHIMKNRNIQFKPTALFCKKTVLLVACLATVSISGPNLASGAAPEPCEGTVQLTSQSNFQVR